MASLSSPLVAVIPAGAPRGTRLALDQGQVQLLRGAEEATHEVQPWLPRRWSLRHGGAAGGLVLVLGDQLIDDANDSSVFGG